MDKITLLIADDHTLLRETWAFIFNSSPDFEVIAECKTGEEAVEAVKSLRPDVVLMDINLPGINGIETTRQIRKFAPGCRILGISQHTQPVFVRKMLLSGATGYVTKNSPRKEMYKAIHEIHKGNKYVCDEIKGIVAGQFLNEEKEGPDINCLSSRELEIITYIKRGHTSAEIGAILYIASKTVEVHRHNILKKLHIKNTPALIDFMCKEQPE